MTASAKILLVDDDTSLLRLLSLRLGAGGYVVGTAENGGQALAHVASFQPNVVITDLRMDGMDGMALYDTLHQKSPTLPVIILTAHGTIPDAVEATQRGVFGYLTKPFDSKALLECIERALRLVGGVVTDSKNDSDEWRKNIVSRSARMESVLRQAGMVAGSDAAVLIQSESGTGKELLARALHDASPRREHAFLAVNCSAIPDALLESELFGHVKGSFTGATNHHDGLFLAANNGTVFLDEVADLSLSSQAKLLRVLQEREVRPVGSTKVVPINVRIISATHRELEKAVSEGLFREDLYYRLNVVTLEIPPLSERREDIPPLVAHFLQDIRERSGKEVQGFSPEAMELLLGAAWPGNVRQLRNVIEQTVALCTTPIIPTSLVQRALRHKCSEVPSLAEARGNFEREYLAQLLHITRGNVSNAARMARRNRTEFYKLLRRYHLDPHLFRARHSEAPKISMALDSADT